MGKISFLVSVSLMVLALAPVWGSTWHVDGSVSASGDGKAWATAFKRIQEGIDASSDDDTVTVAKGTYNENVRLKGKNIVLRSTDPLDRSVVESTIIEGKKGFGAAVGFFGSEDDTCVLSGFTVCNANRGLEGAGARATVERNIISGNSGDGGVVGCDGAVQNNIIVGNSRSRVGGGLSGCDGVIQNNVIIGNSALEGGGVGYCTAVVRNNVIAGNAAEWGGGGLRACFGVIENNTIVGNSGGGLESCGSIRNCIVWGNREGDQLRSCPAPSYSCIEGWRSGADGNIADNPHFVDPAANDFHLISWSPCIDAGDPASPYSSEPQPNGGRVNMGAYGGTPEAACASPDSDRDGLPDDWEVHFFGNLGQAPEDDRDDDGLSNLEEFRYARNPTEAPLTWHVDASVSASGTGKSWVDAFKTIQEGVDAASDGDTVVVAEGTYVENVQFDGESVVLKSKDPLDASVVDRTVIDGNRAGPVVTFAGTENATCVLSGFTLRNGRASLGRVRDGGGVYGGTGDTHTCATIEHNVVTGNQAEGSGGGLAFCDGAIRSNTVAGNTASTGGGLCGCDGTIERNLISRNTGTSGGGLASCDGVVRDNEVSWNSAIGSGDFDYGLGGALAWCSGTIIGNIIAGNSGRGGGGLACCAGTIQNNTLTGNSASYGGGAYVCDGTIENNTIAGNLAGWYGGGLYGCEAAILNCIIWENGALTGPQIHESSVPTYCCIEGWSGGGEGNISENPQFVDPDGPDNDPDTYEDNDYRIAQGSPCVDAGLNEEWMWSAVDLDGNARIMNGTVDMGAFEYLPSAVVILTLYVHERSATGPVLAGVRVTARVGDGITFDKTTDSAGYVDITGAPGTWDFTASKEGYKTVSWSQGIATTCTRHAFLLETAPSLVITSPLEITARELYRVGDVLNAGFTITNRGTDSVVLDTLVVGGRGPTGEIVDFEKADGVTLNPGDSYTYHGSLTLPGQPGTYHFFCAYHTQEHMAGEDEYNWNTNIAVEIDGQIIEDFSEARGYREKDIVVFKETYIGPAPPPAIWEKVSGPWDGESTSLAQIAVQPDNPDMVYAAVRHDHYYWGYEGDELYESTNGGMDWTPINKGLPRLVWGYYYPIGAIAIADSNPAIVYVGTSSLDPYSGLSSGKGIYKSTKSVSGGLEWKPVGGPSSGWSIFKSSYCVSSMCVDPTNPDRAYAGTIAGGLWKTTDGGEAWQKGWEEPINKETLLDVNAICVSTADPNVIYAAAYNFAPSAAKDWSRILIPNRLIRSEDWGDNWENLRWGISTAAPRISDIAVGKGSPRVSYAITTVGYNSRVYKFLDQDTTALNASGAGGPDPLPPVDPVMQVIGFYGEQGKSGSICVHSDRADVIYAASTWGFDGVYFSPNSGDNWFPMGLKGNHIRKLLFASGGGRRVLYAAAIEGLFKIELSAGVIVAQIDSPGELRVYDAQGRITGLVDGEVKEEIPYSAYLDDAVVILSSSDSFSYEVGGKSAERYGLTLASTNELETSTFSASNIPTSADAIHQYSIDWSALSRGEEGVLLQIDSDGDGIFEEVITAGTELRCLEQERLKLSLDGAVATVTLDGLPSREYTMEYTEDLANGTWQRVPGEWPIPGPVIWTENIVGIGKRYYRAILH
ncbi:MAG: right-handed parallel beta-helix repeat-containing protein [bacterium]|nr:right-handed parallel beta-helix repeat-containing protein [bacterium]